MQTLQLLPVSLTLVSIPRHRVPILSSQIVRQILQPSPAKFLNISSNEIELSIFAESHTLSEFEDISRRDRQRQLYRSGSGFSMRKKSARNEFEPVEVSYEQWSVLQVDSHSDLDNSGARVNELSARLAEAGISILYQSSYMSDFIFVKESRLTETMALLANAGFDLYSEDENSLTIPISPSPNVAYDGKFNPDFSSSLPTVTHGSVLTRTRSASDTPSLSSSRARSPSEPSLRTGTSSERMCETPSKSKSPSCLSGEVTILDTDLTCVGLVDDHVDYWSSKIIKVVAFPDLIPCPSRDKPQQSRPRPSVRRESSTHSDNSSPVISDDEEDYFSQSPSQSTSSLLTSLTSRSSRSSIDLSNVASPVMHSGTHFRLGGPLAPLSPIYFESSKTPTPSKGILALENISLLSQRRVSEPEETSSRVPFFSFTRTPEGTSVTTDAELLAMLFPAGDRHMVICGGELDAADQRIAEGRDSREDEEVSDDDLDSSCRTSMLKCLQLDLRKFGLDKHGLISRFSRILEENKINHMYSSTFKTANLLVDKRHALRARSLLRTC